MPATAPDAGSLETPANPAAAALSASELARRCLATGDELASAATVVAVLCEPPEGEVGTGPMGLVRRAVSAEAWDGGFRPEGLVCFWRTSMRRAPAKPRVDDSLLLDLLERYAESPEEPASPRREPLHFILALVLLRRRKLRLAGRSRDGDGGERWLFEARGGEGEPWRISIRAATLDESEIAEAAAALGELLGDSPSEGSAAGAEPATAPADGHAEGA